MGGGAVPTQVILSWAWTRGRWFKVALASTPRCHLPSSLMTSQVALLTVSERQLLQPFPLAGRLVSITTAPLLCCFPLCSLSLILHHRPLFCPNQSPCHLLPTSPIHIWSDVDDWKFLARIQKYLPSPLMRPAPPLPSAPMSQQGAPQPLPWGAKAFWGGERIHLPSPPPQNRKARQIQWHGGF